tara:strand:- start:9410 stop:9532 length:123 start_codon:yes stop_codon:yes gene_type:complete
MTAQAIDSPIEEAFIDNYEFELPIEDHFDLVLDFNDDFED